MTRWIILVTCFLLGYFIVMGAMGRGDKAKDDRPPPSPEGDAGQSGIDEPATSSNWFRILDVPENAGREQISAAYRQKIGQYHPDKVARLGPEIRALAEARSKQINAAYELGMRLRS